MKILLPIITCEIEFNVYLSPTFNKFPHFFTDIPEGLLLQIANDTRSQFTELAMELGLTNVEIEQYIERWPDIGARTQNLLVNWQNSMPDKGSVSLLFRSSS